MPLLKNYLIAFVAITGPMLINSMVVNFADGNINQLAFIGTVEGKSYFVEETIQLSWQEANAFCKSSGMHLATVKSSEQLMLLQNAYDSKTFTNTHWIGGRDSLDPSQFTWDFDDEKINSTIVGPYSAQDGMLTCMCFNPQTKLFYGKACGIKYKILCELRH